MAKECARCHKTLGFFSGKVELRDGYICPKCLKQGGIECEDGGKLPYFSKVIVDEIGRRVDLTSRFHRTKKYGRIELDMSLQAFKLRGVCYPFSKLVSYSFHEKPDNQRSAKSDGKAGGAVIGGIIGGMGGGLLGAAVGTAVGKAVGGLISGVCEEMYITIKLDDVMQPSEKLSFISEKTRIKSDDYVSAAQEADSCMEALEIIRRNNVEQKRIEEKRQQHERELRDAEERRRQQVEPATSSHRTVYVQNGHMSADQINRELTAYRAMMASGLITEAEYNEKKRQLLSLM